MKKMILGAASALSVLALTACNDAPIVDAGADDLAIVGEDYGFAASGSDADGHRLRYSWTLDSAPADSKVKIADADSAYAVFTPDVVGEYTFTVTNSDSAGNSDSDDVVITARIGPKPFINGVPPKVNGVEVNPDTKRADHIAPNVAHALTGAGSSVSPELAEKLTRTWSIASAPESELERIEALLTEATGEPTTMAKNEQLNLTYAEVGTYDYEFTVGDGELEVTSEWTVYVRNPPVIALRQTQTTGTGIVNLFGSDSTVGPGGEATYEWSFVERPATSTLEFAKPEAEDQELEIDVIGLYRVKLVINDGKFESESFIEFKGVPKAQ